MDWFQIERTVISQIRKETRMKVCLVKHTCRDWIRSKTSSKETTSCINTIAMTTWKEAKNCRYPCSIIWWSCLQRRTSKPPEARTRMKRTGWTCLSMRSHQFTHIPRTHSAMTGMHRAWTMLFYLEPSTSVSNSKVSHWKCSSLYALLSSKLRLNGNMIQRNWSSNAEQKLMMKNSWTMTSSLKTL